MTQNELNRAVAKSTEEAVTEISALVGNQEGQPRSLHFGLGSLGCRTQRESHSSTDASSEDYVKE